MLGVMLQVRESRWGQWGQMLLAISLLTGCSELLSLPSSPSPSLPSPPLAAETVSSQLARAANTAGADPFGMSARSSSGDRTSSTGISPNPSPRTSISPTTSPTSPSPAAQSASKPASKPAAKTISPQGEHQGEHQGRFRIGNQTEHPLRIAFLQQPEPGQSPQKSAQVAQNAAIAGVTAQMEPLHWDFAPGEGGQSGLVLSVPQGDVELRPGDVLVAFAQDGSRRYWGPYVVGQTQLPFWNSERSEWQLLIQP